MKSTWTPLFDGDLAAPVRRVVEEIAEALAASPPEGPSLARGGAGQALFFDYASQALGNERYGELAGERLDDAVAALSAEPMSFGLYSGFAGIAWTVEHLQRRSLDDDPAAEDTEDEDDLNGEIDGILLEILGKSPWPETYDLVDGLAGLGVYFLERLPRASARQGLALLADRLAELAETTGEGVTWFTPPSVLGAWARTVSPAGHYNLGVAHGVPGLLPLLATAGSSERLEGAVHWLLAQRDRGGPVSCFLDRIGPGVDSRPARLAWCYGDAGIAAALLATARIAGREDWERDALALARRAATRPVSQAGVQDAGLCHGALGLGHLFNRIFQATGEEAFRKTARFWIGSGLALRRPGEGCAGFPDADSGFLTGAAGIGLALLAAVSPFEPEWDRLLLADIPDRS